jgi:dTMP kinase
MQGQLFVFEGPDGVGKTSIVSGLKERLEGQGFEFQFLSFPGKEDGTLGSFIYHIHHSPQNYNILGMSELAKQALHIAAHIDAIESRIKPLLGRGVNVVLDRFWWSTLVYGNAGGVKSPALAQLIAAEKLVWGDTLPSIAFLVDRDRPINRSDKIEEWLKLRSNYAALASDEQGTYEVVVIENLTSIEDAMGKASTIIKRALS